MLRKGEEAGITMASWVTPSTSADIMAASRALIFREATNAVVANYIEVYWIAKATIQCTCCKCLRCAMARRNCLSAVPTADASRKDVLLKRLLRHFHAERILICRICRVCVVTAVHASTEAGLLTGYGDSALQLGNSVKYRD